MKALIKIMLLVVPMMMCTLSVNAIDWGKDNDGESRADKTEALIEMVDRVKEKFNDVNGDSNVRSTLEEAAKQIKITISDNRPSGDFVSGCSGECGLFRDNMIQLIRDVSDTSNTLRNIGEPVVQNNVNYDIAITAINKAPGPVLYPLYVAFDKSGLFSGLTERMARLPEALEMARDGFENKESKCSKIDPNRGSYRSAVSTLSATSIALTLVGKGLLAKGETNMMAKKKVGIHGYAGVIVEDNKKKKIGNIFEGVAKTLSIAGAKLDRTIYQCEILDELFMHDETINLAVEQHDDDVKELLNEIIRLQLTPQGRRKSDFGGDFPLK